MVRFIGQTWDPDLDSELGIYLPEVKLWKPNAEQEKRSGTLKTSVQRVAGREAYWGLN